MKIRAAVMGAGAVGCYYGGMLARAGHDVVLVGRKTHVDAVNAAGLRFEARGFDERVSLRGSTEASAVAGARMVLFCVKSTDTEAAAAQIAPHLAADAIIVNLQNGVDNTERIQALVAVPVIPAVVFVAAEMAGPGHMKHHGRGELVIGAPDGPANAAMAAKAPLLRDWFTAAGVPVTVSDNVTGELWGKLLINCAYNAISAVAQAPYGMLIDSPGIREVMRDAANEVFAVAAASGVRMTPGIVEKVPGLAATMPTQYSSTAQDLARGRPSEIDHLNGFVVRRGEALGVPVPANRVLYALVKLIEARSRKA